MKIINMEHSYGIGLDTSVKFRSEIENIADKIMKKKAAREYFVKNPFITPDKNFFILQKNNNEQLILANTEVPLPQQAQISFNLNYNKESYDKFIHISTLTKDCTEIISKHLNVDISRVGSIHRFSIPIDSTNSILLDNVVRDLMSEPDNFYGGNFKFLYREKPIGLPELNINILIGTVENNDSLVFEVDINNKVLGEASADDIEGIGEFSSEFINDRLFIILEKKGIIISGK
jgi:hypothetical protein